MSFTTVVQTPKQGTRENPAPTNVIRTYILMTFGGPFLCEQIGAEEKNLLIKDATLWFELSQPTQRAETVREKERTEVKTDSVIVSVSLSFDPLGRNFTSIHPHALKFINDEINENGFPWIGLDDKFHPAGFFNTQGPAIVKSCSGIERKI